MTKDEALDLALEALEYAQYSDEFAIERGDKAITAIKQARSAPVQEPRWYCLDKTGMATLCADEDDARQSAKLAEQDWPRNAPYRAVQLCEYITPPAQSADQGQSCYCPNCEALGKELAALKAQPAPVQEPDETLLKFYDANDYPSLVAEMERHIERLQAKLPKTPSFAPQRVREG